MKKVMLISCYFGTLPNYFNLFLRSCQKNPEVDFLFVTDCASQINLDIPSNFHIVSTSFDNVAALIKTTLDFKCVCHRPYKLCDYRPVYGLLFSEYLKGYDYWGHCDIDLLFGDLKKYIEEPMDEGFKKIFKYGHVTLYKNSPDNNKAFTLPFSGINYKYVFSHKYSFGFDERRGMNLLYRENNLSYHTADYALDVNPPVFIISPVKHPASMKITFYNRKNYDRQLVVWDNGCLFRYFIDNNELKSEEYAYIHLQKRNFADNAIVANRFAILPASFEDVAIIDNSIFSQFDLENKHGKKEYRLPSLYRIHHIWYKMTVKYWNKSN
jgi:hypothetical protein